MTQGETPSLNTVFRAEFYSSNYSAFNNLTLSSTSEIEINPIVPSLCTLTGIDETITLDFKIFPNPLTNGTELNIEFSNAKKIQVELLNLMGQTIFSKQFNQTNILIPNVMSGVYFVRINYENQVYTQKVLVL